jgi:hypothetical protein
MHITQTRPQDWKQKGLYVFSEFDIAVCQVTERKFSKTKLPTVPQNVELIGLLFLVQIEPSSLSVDELLCSTVGLKFDNFSFGNLGFCNLEFGTNTEPTK